MSDVLQASGSRLPATGRSQATRLSQALAGPEARGLWPGAFVDEPGIALIVVLMAMMLIAALGSALVLVTVTETRISANVRDGAEARHAADGAVERVMQELTAISNWNAILTGAATSAFVDGPAGQRTLEDGTRIDLAQETNLIRCAKTTACSDADMDAVTAERPWGANNPRWQLYAYGPMRRMLPNASIDSRTYVAVWLADDSSENDTRPFEDGATDMNPGRGVLAMLVHAYGPGGALAMIEVTVARIVKTDPQRGARILSWREVR
jgi:PilX N-terminal